jgi:iron complex outermembrane receptor protein
LAGVCAAALGGSTAFAQTAAPSSGSSSTQLEEVVVTAERREASLQDVPISVTALNTEKLEAKQVLDVMSLNKVVPGYAAKPTLSPLEISIAIRGVTQLLPSITADPAIGFYVDGVYNVINAGSNLGMIDMERVEVLKGPQGTLFGRNTIGGAVSITTAKPTDDFSGYVKAAVGNHDAQTYTGVINGPIVPGVVDARLVYQHDEHAGYGHNFTTGGGANTLNQDYVRGTVKVTPNDKWEILGSAFYTKAHGTTSATRLGYIDTTNSLAPGFLPPTNVLIPALSGHPGDALSNYIGKGGYWDNYSDVSGYWLKQYGANGTVTGQLNDYVTVKSITAYSKTNYNTAADLDGTPYAVLDLVAYPIVAKQFSEEFQLYGDAFENKLKWIAGAYYFHEDASQISKAVVLGALSPIAAHQEIGPYVRNKSYSAFAQVTYEILPKVRLTGGVRYVTDDREVTYRDKNVSGNVALGGVDGTVPGSYLSCALANNPGGLDPAACHFSQSVTYHYVPWTVGLDYKPTDDALLYAKISKGFRSGAYPGGGPAPSSTGNPVANAAALSTFAPAAPERLVSYEGGAKLEFLDRRLRINGAAYWSKYDNIQLSVNTAVPGCATCTPIATLVNSGSAHIWGGELEATALIQNLTLEGSVGYTHPKYVSGANLGLPVINVSKLNYAIGGSYPVDFSAGTLTLNATYSYRSRATFYTLPAGLSPAANATLSQKGYGLVDARAAFELRSVPLTVAVYGQNLANKKYFNSASAFAPPLSYAVNFVGTPRTFGVSLEYKY